MYGSAFADIVFFYTEIGYRRIVRIVKELFAFGVGLTDLKLIVTGNTHLSVALVSVF